jgi:hypothetical protein
MTKMSSIIAETNLCLKISNGNKFKFAFWNRSMFQRLRNLLTLNGYRLITCTHGNHRPDKNIPCNNSCSSGDRIWQADTSLVREDRQVKRRPDLRQADLDLEPSCRGSEDHQLRGHDGSGSYVLALNAKVFTWELGVVEEG